MTGRDWRAVKVEELERERERLETRLLEIEAETVRLEAELYEKKVPRARCACGDYVRFGDTICGRVACGGDGTGTVRPAEPESHGVRRG